MSNLAPLNNLITRFQEQTPIRASSLIITLYGDAIEPHGGTVWLGSLINLLEPIGINERLIRTSIFRLTKEGWLKAEKVGRRSYYSLTGRLKFSSVILAGCWSPHRATSAHRRPAWKPSSLP